MVKKTYIKPAMNVVQLSMCSSSMLSYSVENYRAVKTENVGDTEEW